MHAFMAAMGKHIHIPGTLYWMGRIHLRETSKLHHFSVKMRKKSGKWGYLPSSVPDNTCIHTLLWCCTSLTLNFLFNTELSMASFLSANILAHQYSNVDWEPHEILLSIPLDLVKFMVLFSCWTFIYDLLFFRIQINRITMNSSQAIAFSQNGE